jgi:[ribosomal protein S5]-alanine N-acetyltransferase
VSGTDHGIGLRQLQPSDAEAVARVIGDPMVLRYTTWRGPSDRAAAERLIETARADERQPRRRDYHWAIVRAEETVGVAGLRIESRRRREASLRALIRRDVQGHGIGTEVVRLLLRVGFEDLGMELVYADPKRINLAARRALQKTGMTFSRDTDDGLVVYSTTREAWDARVRDGLSASRHPR